MNTLYIAFHCVFFPALLLSINSFIAYSTVFLSFIVGSFTLYYSICLYRKIPGVVQVGPFILGVVLVFLGSAIDMMVTVICSPDLIEEGNPVLVALLNNNFSLQSVYLFTLSYQLLKVTITLFLWSSFLKAYARILKLIPQKNFFTTTRWLLGAGKMSWSDFFLSKNIQYELLVPSLIFVVSMSNIFHWYVALEWLEFVPYIASTAVWACIIGFISFFILVVITHVKLKNVNNKFI